MRPRALALASIAALLSSACSTYDHLVAPARASLSEAQRAFVAERRRVDELEGVRYRREKALRRSEGTEGVGDGHLASLEAPSRRVRRPVVVVLDVEDSLDVLSERERDVLSSYLALAVVESGRFVAVPRGTMRRALQDEKADSLRACVDDACHLEVGKALAAELVLSPRITHGAAGCALAATIYALQVETTVWASVVPADCTGASLVEAVRAIAKRLPSAGEGGDT